MLTSDNETDNVRGACQVHLRNLCISGTYYILLGACAGDNFSVHSSVVSGQVKGKKHEIQALYSMVCVSYLCCNAAIWSSVRVLFLASILFS